MDVTLFLVGVGGFLGAIARFLVDGWVSGATGGSFPWRTVVINVSGSSSWGSSSPPLPSVASFRRTSGRR